jgi:hypothetical protein
MIQTCVQETFYRKEIMMTAKRNNWSRVIATGGILFLCLAMSHALADEIQDKIRALEAQQRANAEELERLKGEQIEMRKEATAAAAKLPDFSYRPGSGMLIEAADKSWSFRASMQAQYRLEFLSGRDEAGRTTGEIMARRFRPQFIYCINDCLYEIELQFDLDGFGTDSLFQRAETYAHLEKINPWLPTVGFGGDVSTTIGDARRLSSDTGSQMDYDLLSKNGFNTGSSGSGVTFTWDDRPLSWIGIPGRIRRFQIATVNGVGRGSDNVQTNTSKRDTVVYLGIQPFSQLKDKWLRGLELQMGAWFCNVDDRPQADIGSCDRLRIRDHGDGGRQTLFDTGARSVGRGLGHFLMPGVIWSVGPYTIRAAGGFQRYEDEGDRAATRGRKTGDMFLIGHELYVWSPKGWLTGSALTTGSILLGTHFERNDVECRGCPASINGGQFHRNTILLREWDIFYVLAPRMNFGAHFLWYDASNLRTNGALANQAAQNLGVCSNCRPGQGGDWVDVLVSWRYTF